MTEQSVVSPGQYNSIGERRTCVNGIRIAALLLVVSVAQTAFAGSSNSLMDISQDGKLLACSNRDSGSVTFVETETGKVIREVKVGKKPEGVSFIGTSHDVACCVYGDDKIVVINSDGDQKMSVDVFDEPYGIVSNRDGTRLFATLDYPGRVIEINFAKQSITRNIPAGEFVRGIALSNDESQLFLTEYYKANVRQLDLATGTIAGEFPGASTDNLARQLTVHPTRDKVYVSHIRSRIKAAHGSGSIFPYVSIITPTAQDDDSRTRVPMDSFLQTLVTANPWEVAISPDGRKLYAVFSGTDDIFVCRTIDDDYEEIDYDAYIQTGKNPRAIKVAPDNKSFWVYNALDFQLVQYSTKTQKKIATVTVCKNPLGEEKLQGKILFYTARQPMASRRWISCSSCHPDGDTDGRTWQNPEGLRNTPPLAGLAWTHPLHWSADRDETQDFEHTIRGPLMQGRGLVRRKRGRLNEALAKPLKGESEDLDALAAYTNSHTFPPSPYAKGGLPDSAKRGRDLFLSKETGCATCHTGPMYSDSQPGETFKTHDVGTGNADESELMGPKYDTPTLLGVYRSAPYLHHGKAKTLTDVLKNNAEDRHGKTSHLSDSQIQDMVSFLKCLPYEDAEIQATRAGLIKISR